MNKGLIAKCQNFRGQIEDRHFSRVNDAVFKSTVHSPLPLKQKKIWARKLPKMAPARPNPFTNLTRSKPKSQTGLSTTNRTGVSVPFIPTMRLWR